MFPIIENITTQLMSVELNEDSVRFLELFLKIFYRSFKYELNEYI